MRTICFTGRRPKDLCWYDTNSYTSFVNYLTNYLDTEFYKKGVRRFISGGAQGFDQLAFWAVHNLKKIHSDIENIVYVPFKGQELRWKKDGLFSQNEYNLMLQCADSYKYLYEVDGQNFSKVSKALTDRNHDMVNASDAVIALYPSDDYMTNKGGTSECMRYAVKHHKKIFQIKYKITDNVLEASEIVTIN